MTGPDPRPHVSPDVPDGAPHGDPLLDAAQGRGHRDDGTRHGHDRDADSPGQED